MSTNYNYLDVQQATNASATDLALPALGQNPVAGDLIIVAMSDFRVGTPNHLAPTDNKGGNTYTQIGVTTDLGTGNQSFSLWASIINNGGAGFVVTVHVSLASFLTGIVHGVRCNRAVAYNNDAVLVTPTTSSTFVSTLPSVTPLDKALYFCLGTNTVTNNGMTAPAGWNTAGVNGFTAGMAANAIYGNQSATVSLATEYQLSLVPIQGVFTLTGSMLRGGILASFGPQTPFPGNKRTVGPIGQTFVIPGNTIFAMPARAINIEYMTTGAAILEGSLDDGDNFVTLDTAPGAGLRTVVGVVAECIRPSADITVVFRKTKSRF